MKLATLKNGTRDGCLVVVSHDLSKYALADSIAPNLQTAIDNWSGTESALQSLYVSVENGEVETSIFKQHACESPLPRAYQWLDGSAYINHVELVRKARNAPMPPSFYTDPLMYQGVSGPFLAPHEDIPLGNLDWGCDMEGEIAVITDDVPQGVTVADAAAHIKMVMLCNDISLRGLIPQELGKGFGFVQSKPLCAFSPVCVTQQSLGGYWEDGRLNLPLNVDYNGAPFGRVNAGKDVTFNMAQLIAHAAKTRPLLAGTIIGSGTVSNKDANGGPGTPVSQGGRGYSCIAELRMIETIKFGEVVTPFMASGDSVAIEMCDKDGQSIFGKIQQKVSAI